MLGHPNLTAVMRVAGPMRNGPSRMCAFSHVTLSSSSIRDRFAVAGLAVAALALSACGGSSSAGSSSTAAGTTLQDVKDKGALVVGTEGTYAPFTYHDQGGSGALTGYDVDVAKAVGQQLGVPVKFEETQWDAIFAGLDAGRFDMIANQVSITPERQKQYTFSTPYTVSKGVIVVKKGDTSIASFADLQGKTTAQSLTSNWYDLAKKSGANVQNVEGWAQAVTLLEQGRVDATINDQLTYLDYQKTKGDAGIAVAATTGDSARNAFAFRKGSDGLAKAVDQALTKLRKDGTLAKISDKYFGEDVSS
ncbi:MAG: L-cystine transport system substrate-binding protein [Nocardioidaceae bacterium]|nr:L-cystine transport system substrate-binding protein [Nocardioidaceae bacterium]